MQNVQSTLAIGTIVRGRYLIQRLLSKSDFSAIYLVKDQRAKLTISPLFILKEMINLTKQERNHFVISSMLLRQLDHPALPHIYTMFNDETRSRFYILMSYIEGPNLEMLQQEQPRKCFSLSQTISLVAPLMDAVTYLHNQQPPFVHGNIDPTNIIVPKVDDRAMLVGFGITKEYTTTTITDVVQVPYNVSSYRAPEQYRGKSGTRSDVYALGAIIYTLLTGVTPADALYRMREMNDKRPDPLVLMNELHRAVPLVVARTVHRALAVNAHSRFSTVQHFKRDLEACLKGSSAPLLLIRAKETSNVTHVRQLTPTPVNSEVLEVNPLQQLTAEPIKEETLDANLQQQPTPEPFNEKASEVKVALQQTHEELVAPSAPSEPNAPVVLPKPPISMNEKIKNPVRISIRRKPRVHLRKNPRELVFLIALALCITLLVSVGTGTGHWFSTPGHSNPSSALSNILHQHRVPSSYPTSVPTTSGNSGQLYAGTIYSIAQKTTSKLSLTVMQKEGKISGYFTGLDRKSSFNGTITTAKELRFAVMGNIGQFTLSFEGHMRTDGALVGNYCGLNQNKQCSGDYGLWSAVPASAECSSSEAHPAGFAPAAAIRSLQC